jgi:hypothetical protein
VLPPSLALLRHLAGRLRLVAATDDASSQPQSAKLVGCSACWVITLVEPMLKYLAEQVHGVDDGRISLAESSSDGDGSDGAAQAPPFVWSLHTWGALRPVLQALEALSEAIGTMCLAEAAHPPPSEAGEQPAALGSSTDVSPSSAMTLDRRHDRPV